MKKNLRKNFISLRKNISASQKEKFDLQICANFLSIEEIHHSDTIFAYYSLQEEAGTKKIISHLLASGKKIALPRVIPKTNQLIWHYVADTYNDIQSGSYGILEPLEHLPVVNAVEKGIVLVPGVSFDRYGSRLGFGAGYYDRFLSENTGLIKVGLCYSIQLFQTKLPAEKHDARMDIIVTEEEIIYI